MLDRGGLDVHVQRAILLALSVQARGFAGGLDLRSERRPLQTYAAELLERRASNPPLDLRDRPTGRCPLTKHPRSA